MAFKKTWKVDGCRALGLIGRNIDGRQLDILLHNLLKKARDEWTLPIKKNPLDKLTLKARSCSIHNGFTATSRMRAVV
jgi:hypothetical protein